MSEIVCLHDKNDVETFARRNPFVHIYTLGDLDDFFWPHTTWLALRDAGQVKQLALLYTDLSMRMPAFLALAEPPERQLGELLRPILPVLPRRFHGHLTQSVAEVFADDYLMHLHGTFHKMGLTDRSRVHLVDSAEAVPLTVADTADLLKFYTISYPGNWFVPRMLETGYYFGIRRRSELVCVAGVHVYSQAYKVAALGNVATRPEERGRGLATIAVARLCQELLRADIEYIGLNVKVDNHSAIACYNKLGFERVAEYAEYALECK